MKTGKLASRFQTNSMHKRLRTNTGDVLSKNILKNQKDQKHQKPKKKQSCKTLVFLGRAASQQYFLQFQCQQLLAHHLRHLLLLHQIIYQNGQRNLGESKQGFETSENGSWTIVCLFFRCAFYFILFAFRESAKLRLFKPKTNSKPVKHVLIMKIVLLEILKWLAMCY